MTEIATNLKAVCDKIFHAAAKRTARQPRLVAVSKLQSIQSIISAYNAGQRHFGENYVNELLEKAYHPHILEKCKDIQWHFIGHLQRNKVNKIITIPNLYVIETVDNAKIVDALNNSWPNKDKKLNIMVQVNTSQEKEKQGCHTLETCSLVKHILDNCTNLTFMGLMTIGIFGYDLANGPNPDFTCLMKCRQLVCDQLQLDIESVELSMGMSNDYEHAIELGSTNVRVGSAIFGNRPQKEMKK